MLLAAATTDPLTVPVLVAVVSGVVTGMAGIAVALITTSRQARQAQLDRRAAIARHEQDRADSRDREERDRAERHRAERAEVLEDIVAEIALLAAKYTELNRDAEVRGFGPNDRLPHPSRTGLMRALSRLTTRLGEPDLFEDCTGFLVSAAAGFPIQRWGAVFGVLQARLDKWFLGAASTVDIRRTLRADAEALAQGKLPPVVKPEPLPE